MNYLKRRNPYKKSEIQHRVNFSNSRGNRADFCAQKCQNTAFNINMSSSGQEYQRQSVSRTAGGPVQATAGPAGPFASNNSLGRGCCRRWWPQLGLLLASTAPAALLLLSAAPAGALCGQQSLRDLQAVVTAKGEGGNGRRFGFFVFLFGGGLRLDLIFEWRDEIYSITLL